MARLRLAHEPLRRLHHPTCDLDVLTNPVDRIHRLARQLDLSSPWIDLKPHIKIEPRITNPRGDSNVSQDRVQDLLRRRHPHPRDLLATRGARPGRRRGRGRRSLARRRRGRLGRRRRGCLGRRRSILARLTAEPRREPGRLLLASLSPGLRLLLVEVLRLTQRAPSAAVGARQLRLAAGTPHRRERTKSEIVGGSFLGVGEALVRIRELSEERRISSPIRVVLACSVLPGEPDLIGRGVLRYAKNGVVVDHLFPHILCHSSVSPSPVRPQ